MENYIVWALVIICMVIFAICISYKSKITKLTKKLEGIEGENKSLRETLVSKDKTLASISADMATLKKQNKSLSVNLQSITIILGQMESILKTLFGKVPVIRNLKIVYELYKKDPDAFEDAVLEALQRAIKEYLDKKFSKENLPEYREILNCYNALPKEKTAHLEDSIYRIKRMIYFAEKAYKDDEKLAQEESITEEAAKKFMEEIAAQKAAHKDTLGAKSEDSVKKSGALQEIIDAEKAVENDRLKSDAERLAAQAKDMTQALDSEKTEQAKVVAQAQDKNKDLGATAIKDATQDAMDKQARYDSRVAEIKQRIET